MPKNYRVFISYRRDDCPTVAVRLYELLRDRLPSADVFIDVKSEKADEWKREVLPQLENSTVVLALFGEHWERAGKRKRSTLAMLEEVKRALRWRKSVIPIFWDRNRPRYPKDIRRLKDMEEFKLAGSIDSDIGRLIALMDLLKRHTRPVAFISSTLAYSEKDRTLDGLDYFTSVLTKVTQRLQKENIDVVLKLPPYSFRSDGTQVAEDQMSLVKDVLARPDEYRGAIIAPFEVGPLVDVLATSPARSIHRFPIATIDKAVPSDSGRLRRKLLQPPIAVENHGVYNGGLAGDCAAECIELLNREFGKIQAPRALILMGLEGSRPRADGFAGTLRKKFGRNVSIRSTQAGQFTQTAGQQAIEREIKGGEAFHLIFACNDELALGARNALQQAERGGEWQSPIGAPYPLIIGFDGISDVTRLVDSDDRWLLNTINVNLEDQVAELLKAFVPRLRGDWRRQDLKHVEGFRHHQYTRQAAHVQRILSNRQRPIARRRS